MIHRRGKLPFGGKCALTAVAAVFVCCVFMLSWPRTGIAAEWPKQATISIAGTFPSHVIGPKTKTPPPGDPSTSSLNATVELRGELVVYGAGDGRFETTLNGSSARSTSPARCNDKLTNTVRQTLTRAWIAAGMLYVVRNDQAQFPKGGACGGTTDTLDETLGFKLENGACSFGYTAVHKRNGVAVSWITIVGQRCEITLPGQAPQPAVVQSPGAAAPASGGKQTPPVTPQGPARPGPVPMRAPQPVGPESACTAAPAGPVISKCLIVSCPAGLPADVRARLNITEPQAAENLKHIDAELGTLQTLMDATEAAIEKFQKACRTPGGACSVRGELDATKSKLNDLYDALQMSPEEDVINNTAAAMLQTYQQPDCMNQIFQETSNRLNGALDLIQTAEKLLARK